MCYVVRCRFCVDVSVDEAMIVQFFLCFTRVGSNIP